MPGTSLVSRSFHPDTDGVLSGIRWTSPHLTFSFPTSSFFYGYSGERDNNFAPLTATAQSAVRVIVTWFSSVSNLTFTEITESFGNEGTIRFAKSDDPQTAHAYYPSVGSWGGDTWYNNSSGIYDFPTVGSFAWITYAHEIGHAVGLKHGHESENDYGTFFPALPYDHDSAEYSIMTYRSYVGSPGTHYTIQAGSAPVTLMQADIAALQWMYGANYSYNSGDTVYSFSPTTGQMFINGVGGLIPTANRLFLTIWDGGGNDTYDFSNYGTNLSVDLNPGAWTTVSAAQLARLSSQGHLARGNIANALLYQNNPASLIENVIGGSGNDTIAGNAADNVLRGGPGNDSLNGGPGNDTASYVDAIGGVTVSLSVAGSQSVGGGLGFDTLISIENLIGSNFSDILTGDAGNNTLSGGAGNDTLAGRAGNDTLEGGSGTDTASYANASGSVTVDLNLSSAQSVGGGEGFDTLISIESITGSAFADTLRGNAANNTLSGGPGDDTLVGLGGDDTLDGGDGSDTAAYSSASDAVSVDLNQLGSQVIGADQGFDTLISIENLVGSDFGDTLTGNVSDNTLQGGPGDDLLIGRAGNDTLDGDGGTDTASYANATGGVTVSLSIAGAQVVGGGEGTDTLISIEWLIGGAFDDILTGSSSDNELRGGGGNDVLEGLNGNDTLDGGSGTDLVTYAAASGGVTVDLSLSGPQVVGADQGSDTLVSIESVRGSAFNDVLRGNSLDNSLFGGAGDDLLVGGAANDTLDGEAGIDRVSYQAALGGVIVSLAINGPQSVGGGEGFDTLISIEDLDGSDFADELTGSSADNTLNGALGDDVLAGLEGNDVLNGGGGSDAADYSAASGGVTVDLTVAGPQAVGADQGSDTLISIERLIGSAFGDTLRGNSGANVLTGGAGDDLLEGGAGDDQLNGGPGTDTASYANATGGVTVNLGAAPQAIGGGQGTDTLSSIENIIGSAFNDTLVGDGGANILRGGAGNDTLQGSGGTDFVYGEDGNDSLFGGPGIDHLFGGNGDDNLYVLGNDATLEGGPGFDRVIVLDLAGVSITIGSGVEYVAGNDGNDVLNASSVATPITIGGAAGDDLIIGGSGNDILAGMDGTDEVRGGPGNDSLFAGKGSDNFYGGDGDDLIYILENDNIIDGGDGFDQAIILDTAGVSIVLGNGIEYCAGNSGDDIIDGSSLTTPLTAGGADGNDTVRGGSGNDVLGGAAGNDQIFGNDGNDQLFGGAGNDFLYGGRGNDNLTTGPGFDVCVIEDDSGNDAVFGFEDGLDLFDFTLHSSVASFADLAITAVGSDAYINFTGGQILVVGAAGLIDGSDFIFA